jgi:hypothetical protein
MIQEYAKYLETTYTPEHYKQTYTNFTERC